VLHDAGIFVDLTVESVAAGLLDAMQRHNDLRPIVADARERQRAKVREQMPVLAAYLIKSA
jgi:hypothetical protein